MSLFHYQEWFDAVFKDGITIAIGELFDYRDQIVLGTLNGILAVIDPGRDVDNRHETSSLIEQQFPHPILQVFIGKFVNSYDGPVLAILHPKDLVFYRVVKGEL
uniref:PTHB1 N-terminal domain-containing protein n=1 Tax=Panagrolaimus sp. JU765 TaxID=591449 RepID=A0AC34R3K3_9BILA